MKSIEERRAYQRKWRKANREKCKEYANRWREKNPEKWYEVTHRKRNRIPTEKQKQQSINWYQKNKEKWKHYRKKTQERGNTPKHYRRIYRQCSLELLGGKCIRCGFTDTRALQVDHIDGGGSKDLKGSCTHTQYLKIKKNPDKFQVLCANCNWIKRSENHEHN